MSAQKVVLSILSAATMRAARGVGMHSAAADNSLWVSSVRSSSGIVAARSTVVTGQALTATGVPFPVGTHVELIAEPPADVMESLAVGESVSEDAVAKANIGLDGAFTLKLAPTTSLSQCGAVYSPVNFVLQINSGTNLASYKKYHVNA
jgi:hypothetical protein